jgi:hypothetical protein
LAGRPESMGLVCASVYVLSLILFIPFAFSTPIRAQTNGHGKGVLEGITVVEFPHYQVGLPDSTCFMNADLEFESYPSTFRAFCLS